MSDPGGFLAVLVCVGLYLIAGLLLCIAIDNSARHGAAVRDMPTVWELLTLATWPIALPLLLWANPERRQ